MRRSFRRCSRARGSIGDFYLCRCSRWRLGWWLRSPRGMSYHIIATHVGLASRMGLTTARAVMTTMLVSGAVAGLVGWLQVAGVAGTLYPTVAGGLGFTGVLVALLGRLGPLGILVGRSVLRRSQNRGRRPASGHRRAVFDRDGD